MQGSDLFDAVRLGLASMLAEDPSYEEMGWPTLTQAQRDELTAQEGFDLLSHIAHAHGRACGTTRHAQRGQQDSDQKGNDRNHYQQFDERESAGPRALARLDSVGECYHVVGLNCVDLGRQLSSI